MGGSPPLYLPRVEALVSAAQSFALEFGSRKHPKMRGVRDSKRVGDYIEKQFKAFLVREGMIGADEGNSALGIDLPSLNTDIKSTSKKQPQSSSPFRSLRQKIEGLGHNLLLFVYEREKDVNFNFSAVRFIPANRTGDYATTLQLRELIEQGAGEETLFGWLAAKQADSNFDYDVDDLKEYARALIGAPPGQGWLTLSAAFQWRLQYGRVLTTATPDGVLDALSA